MFLHNPKAKAHNVKPTPTYCVSRGLKVLRTAKEMLSSLNEGTLRFCLQSGKMTALEAAAHGTL